MQPHVLSSHATVLFWQGFAVSEEAELLPKRSLVSGALRVSALGVSVVLSCAFGLSMVGSACQNYGKRVLVSRAEIQSSLFSSVFRANCQPGMEFARQGRANAWEQEV